MQSTAIHQIHVIFLRSLLACAFIGFSLMVNASEKKDHKEKAELMVVVKFAQPSCAMLLESMIKIHKISAKDADIIAKQRSFSGAIKRSEREALGWLYGNRLRGFVPSESLHCINWANQTPIQKAVEKGYADLTDCLLALKADPSDQRGGGPLIRIAAYNNRPTIINRMLQYHPVNINELDHTFGTSALGTACMKGSIEAVRALLDHRADTEATAIGKKTPLIKAVLYVDLKDSRKVCDTVALLVCSDAECRQTDQQGRTALDIARKGYEEVHTILEDPMEFLRTQVPQFAAQGIGKGIHRQKGGTIFRQLEQRSLGVTQRLKRLQSTADDAVDYPEDAAPVVSAMKKRIAFRPEARKLKDWEWGREVPHIKTYISES